MSSESLKDLSNTLGRINRADILEELCMKSRRNGELSENLHISKVRVSEALMDLVSSRLVIPFERDAIPGEKYPIYMISPMGSELLNIGDKLDSYKEEFSENITDFGTGIGYILKYYLGADFKVNHNTRPIKKGIKISMDIEKKTPCEKKNCEIYCKNLIENIVKRFGRIDQFEKVDQYKCSFNIILIHK